MDGFEERIKKTVVSARGPGPKVKVLYSDDSEEEAESALEEIDKEDLEMKKKNPTYPDIKNKVCTISDWVRSIKEYHLQQGYK